MGREKGYKLSPERIKRMQMARERKKLGYTRHLNVVEEMIPKRIEGLFKEWGLNPPENFQFIVEGMHKGYDLISGMQEENMDFKNVAAKVVEFLKCVKVVEVDILCYSEGVESKTEQTGNVLFAKKIGAEYLVESYDEWGRRPGAE